VNEENKQREREYMNEENREREYVNEENRDRESM